jgi:formamidopyrimidine-DNA glycosylase
VPELPEVVALAADLRERVVGQRIVRVDVSAIRALKTFDPPPTALHGQESSRSTWPAARGRPAR